MNVLQSTTNFVWRRNERALILKYITFKYLRRYVRISLFSFRTISFSIKFIQFLESIPTFYYRSWCIYPVFIYTLNPPCSKLLTVGTLRNHNVHTQKGIVKFYNNNFHHFGNIFFFSSCLTRCLLPLYVYPSLWRIFFPCSVTKNVLFTKS